MANELQYINNRGKIVSLTISTHADCRFQQRWSHLFPGETLKDDEVDVEISKWFSRAKRVENISYKERMRFERHGKDTLLFRANELTFIIQDASIVTIEISSTDKRHLNKKVPILSPQIHSTEKMPIIKGVGRPYSQPNFKIFAYASDEEGLFNSVNLGSYDFTGVKGDARLLEDDNNFVSEVLQRFQVKRSTWTLRAVFVQLGKNGNPVQVLIKTD